MGLKLKGAVRHTNYGKEVASGWIFQHKFEINKSISEMPNQ
jgi:hypothetical protein